MRTAWLLLLLAQKFYLDDPIQEDRDRLRIGPPVAVELSSTYDMLSNTFAPPELERPVPRAMNVNTLGEVPDSSWFTNRIGKTEMTLTQLANGPETTGPPDTSRTLSVIRAKQGGITPGFTIRDARGRIYYLKFDPAAHPSLSTGADIISKNFFHAIGYNVPEAFIIYVREEHFVIDPKAVVNLPGGEEVPMDRAYLEFMLSEAARVPDGNVRAVASLQIPGDTLGPFKFYGTRADDANDIFPHEHRRELRGYRVFCAWLNHDDSRSINTLDTYVEGHVRHYLIDFGSTLGSGSDMFRDIAPQDPRAGNEYIIDLKQALRVAYSFGLIDRPWRKVKYPYPTFAEAGRIEAEFFDPPRWRPEYPNPAFDRMLTDDALWAATIVARFSDDAIRAIVRTGDFLSSEAETYLADTVIRRRDKITRYYFSQTNPLTRFRSSSNRLDFDYLGESAAASFEYEWFSFDNDTEELTPMAERGATPAPTLSVPDGSSAFVMVRVRTRSEGAPNGMKAVDVYLRSSATGYEVVGIEREL